MRRAWLLMGTAGALTGAVLGGFALAQETEAPPEAPESLLPPGFDSPPPAQAPATPAPLPTAAPIPVAPAAPLPVAPLPADGEGVGEQLAPITGPVTLPAVRELTEEELSELPTLEELEELSTDELDELFGLKPKYDIPPAARRSLERVGA